LKTILISACVYGEPVRWNATSRENKEIKEWADRNGFKLVPVCPENELFGTPRQPIRLRQSGDDVLAIMGEREVYNNLKEKCEDISQRYNNVVGFIGIANSPSCGVAAGVKGRGSTMKAPMHLALSCPTTEISSMRSEKNRDLFLKRIKKFLT